MLNVELRLATPPSCWEGLRWGVMGDSHPPLPLPVGGEREVGLLDEALVAAHQQLGFELLHRINCHAHHD